jgi:hypothetical protein
MNNNTGSNPFKEDNSKVVNLFPNEKGKEKKEKGNTIPLMKKSLKRYCYFYSLQTGSLPNPIALAGLGDTWLKQMRKQIRQYKKSSSVSSKKRVP